MIEGGILVIEQENKVLLSKDQYDTLDKMFNWHDEIKQINHYYINDLIVEKDITVRVREKNDKLLLQVKVPVQKDKSLHIKKEFVKEISSIKDIILSDELEKLCGYKLGDAKYLNKLETLRKSYNWNENVEVCLDFNKYFDVTDYELEIEYKGEPPVELINKLIDMNVDFQRNIKGKFSRFMKVYYGLK